MKTSVYHNFKVFIIAAFLLSGTQAAAPAAPAQAGDDLIKQPEKGYGVVYVVRRAESRMHYKFHVYLDRSMDENRIGYTMGGQYIYFKVLPGRHELISVGLNTRTIPFEIKAGEVIFIQQKVQYDARSGSNQDPMEIIPAEAAMYYIKHGVEGWIDREHRRAE